MRKGLTMMAAVAALALAGARPTGAAPPFTQPVVTLRDVRLSSAGLDGGTLDVLLSIYNPNKYNLDVQQMTYAVIVDSSQVGSGHTTQRVLLKAFDSSMVHLPVDFTWSGATSAGRLLTMNGYVLYEVKGGLTVASGVGSVTIPFDQHGRFRSLQQSR